MSIADANDDQRIAAALETRVGKLLRSYAELLYSLGPGAVPPVLDPAPKFGERATEKASRAAQLARIAGLEVRTKGGLRFVLPGDKDESSVGVKAGKAGKAGKKATTKRRRRWRFDGSAADGEPESNGGDEG